MHRFARIAAPLTLAAALLPGSLAAQDHRFGAGYNAGGIYFTPFNPSAGQVDGQASADIDLDLGWVIGLQFEQWFGSGRIGARLNGALTERPLNAPGSQGRGIGVWMLDATALLRLMPADAGRAVAPFISLGGGAVGYNLGDGNVLSFIPAGAVYDGDDSPRLAATAGLGFDIRTGLHWDDEPIYIRLEGTDHMTLDSPFRKLDDSDRFGPVHNARVTLGVYTGFGVLR